MPINKKENEMFKQLFLSTAIATAFIATPVLADDHGNHDAKGDTKTYDKVDRDGNKVTPDKKAYKNKADDEKANHPAHDMEGSDIERKNTQGETMNYDEMDREEGEVRPDKKAYDKNGNGKHPAHEMGESE